MVAPISRKYALLPVSLTWLGVIAVALSFIWIMEIGDGLEHVWPVAAFGAFPAILSIIFTPALRQDWAQIMIIIAWLSLAVIACVAISFIPMVGLFICAPIAGLLLSRMKFVEALILALLLGSAVYYLGQNDVIPDVGISESRKNFGIILGYVGAAMFFVTAVITLTKYKNLQARTTEEAQEPAKELIENPLQEAATAAIEETALTQATPAQNIQELKPDTPSQHGAKNLISQFEGQLNLDYIPGAFFLLGPENNVKALNSRAEQIFNIAPQGQGEFTDLLGLNEVNSDEIKALIKRSRVARFEQSGYISLSLEGREPRDWRFILSPHEGGDIGISILDVGQSYMAMQKFKRQAEDRQKALDDKTLFFAGVSHELRTPLNAIIGFSDMMRSRLFGPLPSKYADYADMIHDSGQHMLDLIGDVLDMSKVEAGKYDLRYDHFQATDVVKSTLKMIQPSADKAQIAIEAQLPFVEDLMIHADRRAFRQIVLNLVSNAIKFSPKGSVVTVSAKRAGEFLRLTVADKGVGMSPEMVEKIGEPYLQNDESSAENRRGTGLGLHLVKSLTKLHQGEFHIESTLGQGTMAHIDLPLTQLVDPVHEAL